MNDEEDRTAGGRPPSSSQLCASSIDAVRLVGGEQEAHIDGCRRLQSVCRTVVAEVGKVGGDVRGGAGDLLLWVCVE